MKFLRNLRWTCEIESTAKKNLWKKSLSDPFSLSQISSQNKKNAPEPPDPADSSPSHPINWLLFLF